MKVLVIGGTGPTGVPLVRDLVANGHQVTLINRGLHPKPEQAGIPSISADPYDEPSLANALGDQTWDVVIAMYGRLRRIAEMTKGRCGHFVSVGGVPAYSGWTDAWQHVPAGMPVPVGEDADLVEDPAIDERGIASSAPNRPCLPLIRTLRISAIRTSMAPTNRCRGSGRSCGGFSTAGAGSSWPMTV